jgi:hypothetical protein
MTRTHQRPVWHVRVDNTCHQGPLAAAVCLCVQLEPLTRIPFPILLVLHVVVERTLHRIRRAYADHFFVALARQMLTPTPQHLVSSVRLDLTQELALLAHAQSVLLEKRTTTPIRRRLAWLAWLVNTVLLIQLVSVKIAQQAKLTPILIHRRHVLAARLVATRRRAALELAFSTSVLLAPRISIPCQIHLAKHATE